MSKSTKPGTGPEENKPAKGNENIDLKYGTNGVPESGDKKVSVNREELSAELSKSVVKKAEPQQDSDIDNPTDNPGDDKNDPAVSFIDKIYNQITSVIGGDNPNQFFCMGLLGMLIEPGQYTYNLGTKESKPAFVAANESKLVNRLFDASKIATSDNGRHLSTQYKTALDTLTPKLNSKLFEVKTELRKVLMTPYPYTFEDGTQTSNLTLQQVFYRLYSDYVKVKQEWSKMQIDKMNEITEKYIQKPEDKTPDNNRSIRNDYLNWYAVTAESQILSLEEKLGKVLSVFSPGDMAIITGILDSGTGRELSEARATLANAQQLGPGGGYIYPVTLYPEDWTKLLKSSANAIDLLESTTALSQKMSVLLEQRNSLNTQINALTATIPTDEALKTLKDNYTTAQDAYNSACNALHALYAEAGIETIKALVDILVSSGVQKLSELSISVVAKIVGSGDIDKLLQEFKDTTFDDAIKTQNKMIQAASKLTYSSIEYYEKKNKSQYKTILEPLKIQLSNIDSKIENCKEQIAMSNIMKDVNKNTSVLPNDIPENFMQVIIDSNIAEANASTYSTTTSTEVRDGVSFFFGGYSNNNSHKEAINKSFEALKEMQIQIGMSVSKVQIDREWFNPGVFALSEDMYNYSNIHISPSNSDYEGFIKERFKEMNQCVFPCFPTSFIIAKDMTIKFSLSGSDLSTFAQTVEEHSANGGGFFIFSGSRASASNVSGSNSVATSSSDCVTVRFKTPQILGYYLQSTPADKSISVRDPQNNDSDNISIFDFIKNFQGMLDDYNKTYHKETLNMQMD